MRGQLRGVRSGVRQGPSLTFLAEPFEPAPGLGNPQAQTLLAYALRRPRALPLRRERLVTPDGDFLDVDWLEAPPERPHLLVLHGLEGSSASGYVGQTLHEAKALGWGAVAMNFRSCSGEPNRKEPRRAFLPSAELPGEKAQRLAFRPEAGRPQLAREEADVATPRRTHHRQSTRGAVRCRQRGSRNHRVILGIE